jgi:hypothetical protein
MAKKNLRCFQRRIFLLKKYKLLHGADDQTIAINSTFDGDTEESIVENITLAGAGGRSTGRSATSQNQSHSSDSSNDEKLFHFLFSYYCLFYVTPDQPAQRKNLFYDLLLLLSDNKSVAIDETFNGNAEEGFVPNVTFAGTGGGSAG